MKVRLTVALLTLPLLAASAIAIAEDQPAAAPGQAAVDPNWKVPRTSWGDPDLRGKWPVDNLSATPRERPVSMGTRRYLTDEEYAAAVEAAQAQLEKYDLEDRGNIMGLGHWTERSLPLRQTSLIVEPENGRYPPLTPEGERLKAAEHTSWNTEVFDKMSDFGIWDRCITRGLPASMMPGAYNMGIEIFQSPGQVVITIEMAHETRIVHLDDQPPPPAAIKSWLGYSRGHWEGTTLVIETTNFLPGASAGPAPNSDQLHIVEHLTPVGPDEIHYEAWVEDPVVMTTGYKIDVPWRRNDSYGMFEYACHEHNVQVRGYILATSPRFAKQREENWAARAAEAAQGSDAAGH